MKKKISLPVTQFALPAPRKGSIDTYSGLKNSQMIGMEVHQRLQSARAEEFPNYRAEVFTNHTFETDDYNFEILGKMDGIFDFAPCKIEEIKSSFNVYELFRRLQQDPEDHPYCLQVRTYGYFHFIKTGEVPDLVLHLVSTRNGDTIDFKVPLNVEGYEAWLRLRLAELVDDAKLAEKRAKRRRKAADNFTFPFEQPREGQIELIQTIEEGMKEERPMLLQAPTGLGKTMGVMYPTLREALARGQRAIYITPKNSQHAVAEEALDRLRDKGANIKSMTITAKSKMCFKNEPICNPEFCEYAKDHYTKVAENKLIEELSKKRKLTARTFKKLASEHQVCPFELQLDAAIDADTVICDYNYVFAPRSAFGRLAACDLDQEGKPNLIIDEAHNLPSRAMDYYSPTLSVLALEKMRDDAALTLPLRFRKEAMDLINSCIVTIRNCAPIGVTKPCKIKPPIAEFLAQELELRTFMSSYLNSDVEIQPKDVVLRLCFYWSEFANALEFIVEDRPEFFTTFNPNPMQIKITCCDAADILKESYKDYGQVIGFSATLKPFDYYSRLAGLQSKKLKTAEFSSPFEKSQRKLLIIPQLSSKYSERERNYPKIAEAISRIAGLKRGNYFAFFPSFEFLNRVLQNFEAPPGFEVIRQYSGMHRDAIDDVLTTLREGPGANIVFAVQGGVFSEGVDYPGKMAIGAFVVGPPLPNFDLVREEMRQYYEANYSAGFDYAYTFPAMAKAVQAAGRVIRSETDRGIIVLMDNRFIQPSYAKSMPRDWFDEDPRELVSQNILADIQKFWTSTEEALQSEPQDHSFDTEWNQDNSEKIQTPC